MGWILDMSVDPPVEREHTEEELAAIAALPGSIDGVICERDRRLALGFDYDFGDARSVHHIGTTEADMKGWNDVTSRAQAAIALGSPETAIQIDTDTGTVTVTARDWMRIMMAAGDVRQPIWQASFVLLAMDPIPGDFADDDWWTAGS